MEVTDKDVRRIALILFFLILGVLVFLVVRPVLISIVAGLILAYVFFPLHVRILKYVKKPTLAAAIVSVVVIALIAIPLWFLVPLLINQVFKLFQASQSIDVGYFVKLLMPSAQEQFVSQTTLTINTAISKISSSVLDTLINFLIDFPRIALHLLLVSFVFFFALRDHDTFGEFVAGLSPLNKSQEKTMVNQFKGITDAIIYGQVVIGVLQGILVGIGLLLFGVDNALVLTVIAVVMSIIPMIGPGFVYVPVALFLFVTKDPVVATGFLAYNLLFVSTIDNLLRAMIVSRKTDISQAIIVIGMVGGLLVFGILGLILGPLIVAYFVTVLRAYKDKTLSSAFNSSD